MVKSELPNNDGTDIGSSILDDNVQKESFHNDDCSRTCSVHSPFGEPGIGMFGTLRKLYLGAKQKEFT